MLARIVALVSALLFALPLQAALVSVAAPVQWNVTPFEPGSATPDTGSMTMVYDTTDGSIDYFRMTVKQDTRADLEFVGTGSMSAGPSLDAYFVRLSIDVIDLSGAIAPGRFGLVSFHVNYVGDAFPAVDYWRDAVAFGGGHTAGAVEHDWAEAFFASEIPEPGTMALLSIGAAAGMAARRRRAAGPQA